jgi:flagellar protein FliO/FliZ
MTAGTIFSSLLAVILALGVVLGLAWLVIKGLRKWQDRLHGGVENGERPIRLLRAMPVGQNERIALVEIRNEVMLIGVASGGVSLLARWPADLVPMSTEEDVA